MRENDVSAPETARLIGLRPQSVAVVVLWVAAAAFYFPWRISALNSSAPILSAAMFAGEVAGLVGLALYLFMTSKIVARTAPAPLDDVTVDIFIPTYNEPVSMLRRTLAAAKQVRRATRVVLLDDGNRAAMRELARELGVDYLARTENTHAKAGNLNNGLAHSTADFIATFDADHAPAPDFLEQTLGYFRSEGVAIIQTPQDFYNLDSFQHRRSGKSNRIWHEQSLFFRVIQPAKDRWNAAFYCGSCAVLRRSSLESIGGFATGTITEDLHTSVKLHKAGFKSVYHNVSLAFGVAPASYEAYTTQRVRWGQGAMQVWRKERILFGRGLTLAQRLWYLGSIIVYFDGWQKLLVYTLPPLVLITGVTPFATNDGTFLLHFVPLFALSLILAEEVGRGYAPTWRSEQYNFLRFPAFLRATLALVWPHGLGFKVTNKATKSDNASAELLAMAILPALAIAAIPIGVWRFMTSHHMPLGALLAGVVWAVLLGVLMTSALAFAWSRRGDRRDTYRFSAPLPLDVHLPSGGGWNTVRALDMTPDGVRLAAPMGLQLAVGQKFDAVLRLPGADAPVALRIRHRAVVTDDALPQRVEVGCEMTWSAMEDQDRLNAFLFGAGFEQRLIDMTEQGPAPLDAFTPANDRTAEHEVRRGWAPASVEGEGRRFDVATQPTGDEFSSWRVLSYEPLPGEAMLRLRADGGEASARIHVANTTIVQTGPTEVHVSTIKLGHPANDSGKGNGAALLLSTAVGALAALAVVSGIQSAQSATVLFGGAEGGANSTYAYVGAVTPIFGDESGWAARVSADRLTYSYEVNGGDVDAEGFGGEAAIVARRAGNWGWGDVSVGVRFRDTDLTPGDPGNPNAGAKTGVAVATQGRAKVSERVDFVWLGGHSFEGEDTMVRVGADRDMGGWRLGADASHFSGPRYGENRVGLTAEWRTSESVTLQARAGASRNDDGEGGGYAGLGLAVNLR